MTPAEKAGWKLPTKNWKKKLFGFNQTAHHPQQTGYCSNCWCFSVGLILHEPGCWIDAVAMPGASSNSTFEISNSPCHAGDYATVKAELVAGEVSELTRHPVI